MAETNEPRALGAALSAPAFATRGAGLAMHVADRHVERWAPESGANRVRSLRSLGFVDRLIAPWIETAQRSASLRMFDQYTQSGFAERPGSGVSWVFPRPWYQDELDWMAAARRAPKQEVSPSLFTTRGTYVSPQQVPQAARPSAMALPSALYEYVAPSMSIAQPAAVAGVGYGGESVHPDAYSPLIPLAAVQAAQLMSRTVAPAAAGARMSPALRSVLSAMIERAAVPGVEEPTRLARIAPELVTPPAPRPPGSDAASERPEARPGAADQLAELYAEQRARIVELQRLAQRNAEREIATRTERESAARAEAAVARPPASVASSAEHAAQLRETARRVEAQLREAATGARASSEDQRRRIEAERTRLEAERAPIETERAPLEARASERSAGQRLHEQARAAAAEHARTAAAVAQVSAPRPQVAHSPAAPRTAPPEIAAAIAALPPEIAAFIGQRPDRAMQAIDELDVAFRTIELIARSAASGASFQATRGPRLVMPAGLGGLVSAVDRTAALTGGRATGEPQASIGAAPSVSSRPAALERSEVGAPAARGRGFAPALAAATRVPSLSWLATESPRPMGLRSASPGPAPAATALDAVASAPPATLAHVAWADRWLARFAGASKASLDALGAPARMEALAAAAPVGVFVSPTFDIERDSGPARNVDRLLAAADRRPTLIAPPPSVIRYADDAETPDDVFTAISAAATRQRTQPAPGPRRADAGVTTPAGVAPHGAMLLEFADRTPADVIAGEAPAAPSAGLSAQLAASPFAPALRHIVPMPTARSFDVRSLFSSGLSAVYLAGLVSSDSHELELAPRARPNWAAPGLESLGGEAVGERSALAWDATYVAPSEPGAEAIEVSLAGDAAASFASGRGDAVAPTIVPDRAEAASFTPGFGDAVAPMEPAALAAAERAAAQAMDAAAPITTLRTALLSWSAEAAPGGASAQRLFGWVGAEVEALGPASDAAFATAGLPVSVARAMLDSMSLPMLGDVAGIDDRGGAWMAPGMIASSAHSWSVAQERSASDLALDFVTPELVLAARVYGLGASEAAQAARLAIAGSGHLTAMAGTVDRAFIQAMAIDSTRRERLATLMTAYPVPAPDSELGATSVADPGTARGVSSNAELARGEFARTELVRGEPAHAEFARGEPWRDEPSRVTSPFATQMPSATAFGVDRRAPRGAFLWPSASVAALGLNAALPEGQSAMSVAALELLAARTVAELGTFAAFDAPSLREFGGVAGAGGLPGVATAIGSSSSAVAGANGAFDVGSADLAAIAGGSAAAAFGGAAGSADVELGDVTGSTDAASASAAGVGLGQRYPFLAGARRLDGGIGPAGEGPGLSGDPDERDVLAAAGGLVPVARRARFEALYLALGQSTAGRSWSPAARAARALALAGRTEDVPLSARERAASAWDVLPVVYATEGLRDAAMGLTSASDGARAMAEASAAGLTHGAGARELLALGGREQGGAEASTADWIGGYAGAGLGALSARAGEALGAYVAPVGAPASSSSSSSSSETSSSSRDRGEQGAVLRAPTAMQELVRTGRPAGRHGGGEAELPPWFEAAARKMFESQGTIADGVSIAELTLVTAAPSTHIAASTRSSPGSGSQAPSASAATEKAGAGGANNIDIEATAQEIYRYILTMMDVVRARNGEPHL